MNKYAYIKRIITISTTDDDEDDDDDDDNDDDDESYMCFLEVAISFRGSRRWRYPMISNLQYAIFLPNLSTFAMSRAD